MESSNKKSIYAICVVVVTVGMIIIKITATVVNKTVVFLLSGG